MGSKGLCVAKMVPITGPKGDAGNLDYKIDATEVTKGQYDAWLATNPPLPASTDANCGYVKSYAEQATDGVDTGPDADHHPVVYVDWCDAYAYCSAVDKRLCGAIGGGTNYSYAGENASNSQWYRACSAGGTYFYTYGNTYQPGYCNGSDYWSGNVSATQRLAVGSLPNCVTTLAGYAGVYDLNGNVDEWEDGCDGPGKSGWCCSSGGSFINNDGSLACGCTYLVARYQANQVSGFRCCS
jgi:formylglycine-generating enzyme